MRKEQAPLKKISDIIKNCFFVAILFISYS